MPEGWFHGRHGGTVTIPRQHATLPDLIEAGTRLQGLFAGQLEEFAGWIRQRISGHSPVFELAANEKDLEEVSKFMSKAVGVQASA